MAKLISKKKVVFYERGEIFRIALSHGTCDITLSHVKIYRHMKYEYDALRFIVFLSIFCRQLRYE